MNSREIGTPAYLTAEFARRKIPKIGFRLRPRLGPRQWLGQGVIPGKMRRCLRHGRIVCSSSGGKVELAADGPRFRS